VAADTVNPNELKMLKVKVLSSHPWAVQNVNRTLVRLRRDLGDGVWKDVVTAVEQVKSTKDLTPWYDIMNPLIEQVSRRFHAKLQKEKDAARLEEEHKKQEELKARMVTDGLIKAVPTVYTQKNSNTVVVRRINKKG
jgi:hypothetical protein